MAGNANNSGNPGRYPPQAQLVELERLRRELAYRKQLNEQQNNMIAQQVWQLKKCFDYFVSFLKKIIDLPAGQINDPSLGKHYFFPFLLATPSSPSWTFLGLF